MPHSKTMQCNMKMRMHFQPVGQGKASLLSSWQTSSMASAPGRELQTAHEAKSTSFPHLAGIPHANT